MPPAATPAAGIVAAPSRTVLWECAMLMYREYGAAAYQAFVVTNPRGRIRIIERAITRGWGAA